VGPLEHARTGHPARQLAIGPGGFKLQSRTRSKIESAELVWKGVAYRGDREFLEACCGFDPAKGTPFDSDAFLGYVMRAGTEVRFLEFSKTADPAVFAALQQAALSRDLQLNVCYCSIFDECWQTSGLTSGTGSSSFGASGRPRFAAEVLR
jgi:hypothetical protein